MIGGRQVTLSGTLGPDPDSIPRGFIHREPDILNAQQQNTLREVVKKMADFNEKYLATHPQVEALVRLLIRELILHKPYYVREFIKEILSREDLETQIAKIVADKKINLDRRHTGHYFCHTQTWEDEAAGKDEPSPLPRSSWPDPWPYDRQTPRDKREYSHPHYFKVPGVFHPTEYLTLKESNFETEKSSEFYSRSYARTAGEDSERMTTEEMHKSNEAQRHKESADMTNEELIKTLKLRKYFNAACRNDFLDKSRWTTIREAMKEMEPLKAAYTIPTESCWKKVKNKPKISDDETDSLTTPPAPHPSIATFNDFKSPGKVIEKESIERLFPTADLKNPSIDQIDEKLASQITIYSQISMDTRLAPPTKILVSTKDLEGNIVNETELALIHKHAESKKEDTRDKKGQNLIAYDMGPEGGFFSGLIDERTLLIDKHKKERKHLKESETSATFSNESKAIEGLFPTADLKNPSIDQKDEKLASQITIYSQISMDTKLAPPTKILVSTKDLEGNIVNETELALIHKHAESKKEDTRDKKGQNLNANDMGPEGGFFSGLIDERTLLIDKHKKERKHSKESETSATFSNESKAIEGLFPTADLKNPSIDQKDEKLASQITIYSQISMDTRLAPPTKILVSTKDLEGNVVNETELALRHKHAGSKKEDTRDKKGQNLNANDMGPGGGFFSGLIDERTLLIDKHKKERKHSKESETSATFSNESKGEVNG